MQLFGECSEVASHIANVGSKWEPQESVPISKTIKRTTRPRFKSCIHKANRIQDFNHVTNHCYSRHLKQVPFDNDNHSQAPNGE